MKREDYLNEWRKLSPIMVRMTQKQGLCNHELGDAKGRDQRIPSARRLRQWLSRRPTGRQSVVDSAEKPPCG